MFLRKTTSVNSYITILLLFITVSTSAQVMTSSCVPTPQMESIYRNDVVKTATNRLFEIGSVYKDSVEIPTLVRDSIAKALYAVYNMPASPLRDTIRHLFAFQDYNVIYGPAVFQYDSLHIHNNQGALYVNNMGVLYGSSIKEVQMNVPDSAVWAQQWASGNISNTVNSDVNALVLQYGISVTNTGINSGRINFNIKTGRAVNTFGLSKAFNVIINNQFSPYGAGPRNYGFDGNSLELQYQPDGIIVTYGNRCGDCYAGCNYGRRWAFKVYYSNCGVQYLGATNFGSGTNPFDPNTSVFACTRGPVLPVTFAGLTGYLAGSYAALTWKVLTQVNVKEYIIERSNDGQQFYTTDKVAANSLSSSEYRWKDAMTLSGIAWYRIKAVDKDGKEKYSSIVKIAGIKANSFTIYPNPVRQYQFTIQFATPLSGRLQARLYSANGKNVWATTINVISQTANHNFILPASIVSGMYALVIETDGGSYRQTLVVGK